MTDPVATLTVDGDPDEYMEGEMWAYTVRIDGPLPTVTDDEPWPTQPDPRTLTRVRPLRTDDRVFLAYDPGGERIYTFATATVKGILGPVTGGVDERGMEYGVHCIIEVTDVDPVEDG